MIVTKLADASLIQLTIDLASWLLQLGLTVHIQERLYQSSKSLPLPLSYEMDPSSPNFETKLKFWEENQPRELVDFVITLGGDGTVLFAAFLFQEKVPPIIPFNLGSLGFLTVFDHTQLEPSITHLLKNEQGMRMVIVDLILEYPYTLQLHGSPSKVNIRD